MWLSIEGVAKEVEKEVNELVEHLRKEFGCVSKLSEEFPGTGICVAIDVKMPEDQTIFLPSTQKVSVFSINTSTQVMTLMYFPDEKDKEEVIVN